MTEDLTHVTGKNQAGMVDVSHKVLTKRAAEAEALVFVGSAILERLIDGELRLKKGPVLQTAILAGTMAAKKTSDLIPLCHTLGLESCHIDITAAPPEHFHIKCHVSTTGRTGVEMEALTGASVAALTIYDMCKALSLDLRIDLIRLMSKEGGKRNFHR